MHGPNSQSRTYPYEVVRWQVVDEGPRSQHLVPLEPLDGGLRVAVHHAGQVHAVALGRRRVRRLHPHLGLDCVGERERKNDTRLRRQDASCPLITSIESQSYKAKEAAEGEI